MNERQQRQHLLDLLAGRLSEEERERLEDRLLADDELFAELAGAEDDLVDAFVRGDLEPGDERALERLLMGSERVRESAELGAALSAYPAWQGATEAARREGSAPRTSRRRSTAKWLFFGLWLATLVLLVVLSLRQARARDGLESRLETLRIELEEGRQRAGDLERRLAREEAENRLMRSPE